MIEIKLHHRAVVGGKGIVAGIIGEAKSHAGDMVSIPADDILLIEEAPGLVLRVEDPLKLIDQAQKKTMPQLALGVQVNIILLKFISFLAAVGRVIAQSPEFIGERAVG